MSLVMGEFDDREFAGGADNARLGLTARVIGAVLDGLAEQRDRIFLWCPVFLGAGIGTYFSLAEEPQRWVFVLNATLALFAAWSAFWPGLRGPALLVIWFCAGFGGSAIRSHWVASPVLLSAYSGPVEGVITKVDRASNGRMRLTLGELRMALPDGAVPRHVRVSLARDPTHFVPTPGQRIALSARLNAPASPTEPGGYDFRRLAWFRGLGGTGFATGPPVRLPGPDNSIAARIDRQRSRISHALVDRLGPRDGGFAAAILTGDRSGLDRQVVEQLRVSNLAHLMAISGLHMGLMSGLAFALVRLILALFPRLSLRLDAKAIAASGAVLVTFGYLLMSGNGVPAQRAFIMVLVVMGAIIFGRRAITLRSLAVAAVIVLGLRPESLAEPGFQMSFAATTALVAVLGSIQAAPGSGRVKAVFRWVLFLGLSSLVAGMATAPFAAAHFNRVPSFGLVANMLAVPMMGFVVMPSALGAAVLWPVGLENVALNVMSAGIGWILWVANLVSNWPGAVHGAKSPAAGVVPLLAAGGLMLALWKGRGRWIGSLLVGAAFWGWVVSPRPILLIADQGKQIGAVLVDGKRALHPSRSGRFVTESWLENDGMEQDRRGARRIWPDRFPADLADGWQAISADETQVLLRGTRANHGQIAITPATLRPGEVLAIWPDGSLTTTMPHLARGRPWAPARPGKADQ